MSMFLAWMLFPAVLGTLSLGLGLLLERASGARLGLLLLPSGFASLVAVTQLPTTLAATARLAVPFAIVAAAAGFVVGGRRLWPLDRAAAAAALAVFAVYAAPIVLSGQATFAGYITLDDTATFLALTDRALEHGRDIDGLPPSTYEATLDVNLTHGYPLGTFTPLGTGARIVHEDPAWVFQPYMAFAAALLALSLYTLLVPLVRDAVPRALVAALAAQPALLYAYSLWGGVKEVVAASLLACAAALAARHAEALIPFAVVCAGLLGVLSVAALVWLAPLLLVAALRAPARRLELAGVVGFVLSVPALAAAGEFLRSDNRASFTSGEELGNLVRPLHLVQALGVWPSGDFRNDPAHLGTTRILLVLVAAAAVAGLVLALRARAVGLPLYALASVTGLLVFVLSASPWVEAKSLAIASPPLLALALAAGARGPRTLPLLGVVALGVLWSNVAAYAHASLAPRNQLRELERAGEQLDGAGPALLTDYQVYGARHFLRELDPESASELRRRFVYLRNGTYLEKGASADVDAFRLDQVLVYRTLVLRRGPAGSRPPSTYALALPGAFYDAWLAVPGPQIIEHLPLGSNDQAAGVPRCAEVMRLARLRGTRKLVASPGPAAIRLTPQTVSGVLTYAGKLAQAGRYDVWLGGSVRGAIEVTIGGRTFRPRDELNWPGLYTPLGTVTLPSGRLGATVWVSGTDLRPGSSGEFDFGPVVLSERVERTLTRVPVARARSLCGRPWDWVEATR